jgi:undecaprenyl-diphosphatase
MNIFDNSIIDFVNQFSQQSKVFDYALVYLSYNNLLKGGILAIIIWWCWFKKDDNQSVNRKNIILVLISCILAITIARSLALTLPFRFRPIHEEDLIFILPYGVSIISLEGWSSFPSDHAVLSFTLSVGILHISKKIGIFSIIYSLLFISFPRIYLGLHYPTDIIAGAFIGIMIYTLIHHYFLKSEWLQSIEDYFHLKPGISYSLFFLVTYQIADMFNGIRSIMSACWKLLQFITT